jgi:hypothetical protein
MLGWVLRRDGESGGIGEEEISSRWGEFRLDRDLGPDLNFDLIYNVGCYRQTEGLVDPDRVRIKIFVFNCVLLMGGDSWLISCESKNPPRLPIFA